MNKTKLTILVLSLFSLIQSFAQNAEILGVILDKNNNPIENINVISNLSGTTTNSNGFYSIKVTSNQDVNIEFTHINYKKISLKFNLNDDEIFEFNPIMDESIEQIATIILNSRSRDNFSGVSNINPEVIRKIRGAQPGVENLLKTLPGVSISNELSTQYSVRGGNFDENLVYVNDVEVYRPFLVRSGQQEGLSFVNTDLIKSVKFSSGGFQSKYGDKMSSVLDIKYRKPVENKLSSNLNLLGSSISSDFISDNSKISNILGFRYRDNSLLVQSRETKTNYKPSFIDFQNLFTYTISDKIELSFLSNISINDYNYKPKTRQTNFGTLEDPTALVVYYNGQEKDKYKTFFSSLTAKINLKKNLILKVIASTFNTVEKEYFDILAQYNLGEVNSSIGDENLGEVEFSEGIGAQLNHARNSLDALIFNIENKLYYKVDNNNFEFSVKYSSENIDDRIIEWEIIDSAGFSIDPPFINSISQQPYESNQGPILPFSDIRSTSNTTIKRLQSYLQWSKISNSSLGEFYYNAGLRLHGWKINENKLNTVISPRAQFAIKPNWEKDMLFRFSTGIYYQPPFYRELRGFDGYVNYDVKAQKSIHFVLSNDYSFELWNRPFKLLSELYYKNMDDVNTYTIDNVRIRYSAENNAKAYAYGLDLRLNGEFVPGTESWFSLGYLKTEENINDQGYIARPTDQRLKFGILFQDYVPNIPDLKMYLNLIYNTGVPGGAPSYSNPYNYLNRLPDYKRADLGVSYIIVGNEKKYKDGFKSLFEEFTVGLEIFNMFNVQNSITNTWVRDVYSKRQFSIPNYLTPRIFNLNLEFKF
ncbi:MAG: TonB-dependent receptor plug domain-containing protein [Flavobacteriaceae bacterium]|nr:TonB-dependent receptor plug domain-containing protein [Flavobacteriaceae bacterium]